MTLDASEGQVIHRWSLADTDLDHARRAVRRANAVTSRADPGRTLYWLADCWVEVCEPAAPMPLIDGTDEHTVRDAATRLGYNDRDGIVFTVERLPAAAW
jgi:hypothetical protein